VLDQAAADLGVARTKLDQIIASFRALGDKLAPVLHTPPGRTNILDAARDHMSRALEVINTIKANLEAHGTALRALAPAPGEVPPPIAGAPSATRPAEHAGDDAPHDHDDDRSGLDRPNLDGDREDSGYLDGRDPDGGDDDSPRHGRHTALGRRSSDPVHRVVSDVAQVAAAAVGAGLGVGEHLLVQAQHHLATPNGLNGHNPLAPATHTPGDPIITAGNPQPPAVPPAPVGGPPAGAPAAHPAPAAPHPGPPEHTPAPPHAAKPGAAAKPAPAAPQPPSVPQPPAGQPPAAAPPAASTVDKPNNHPTPAAPPAGGQAGVTAPSNPATPAAPATTAAPAPNGRAADRTDQAPIKPPQPEYAHAGGQAGVTAPPP
jgi:hypothetical protein